MFGKREKKRAYEERCYIQHYHIDTNLYYRILCF